MFPGQSGIDLCRELRTAANGDEMFILLVTARDHTEDLEQALAAGRTITLTKPSTSRSLNIRLSSRRNARFAISPSGITPGSADWLRARTLTKFGEHNRCVYFR